MLKFNEMRSGTGYRRLSEIFVHLRMKIFYNWIRKINKNSAVKRRKFKT